MTPFDIEVDTPIWGTSPPHPSWRFRSFSPHVKVTDEHDEHVGSFKQKFFSIGGAFNVLGKEDQDALYSQRKVDQLGLPIREGWSRVRPRHQKVGRSR